MEENCSPQAPSPVAKAGTSVVNSIVSSRTQASRMLPPRPADQRKHHLVVAPRSLTPTLPSLKTPTKVTQDRSEMRRCTRRPGCFGCRGTVGPRP
jgi:hypothetical protein